MFSISKVTTWIPVAILSCSVSAEQSFPEERKGEAGFVAAAVL